MRQDSPPGGWSPTWFSISAGVVFVTSYWLAQTHRAALVVEYLTYPLLAASVASFAWLLLDSPSNHSRALFFHRIQRAAKGASLPLVVGLVLTTTIYLSIGPDYRILADETNLLSTAFSLHLEQRFSNITECLYYFRAYHPIARELPLRPGLYPFFVSLLHSATGMRGSNGFAVQFGGCVATLAGTMGFFRHSFDLERGVVAAVCLASFPLFGLCATSAGFDAMNFGCLVGVMIATTAYVKRPTGWNLELIAHAILFAAGCRYESLFLFLPLAALVPLTASWSTFSTLSVRSYLFPFLLLPSVLLRLSSSHYENPGDHPDKVFALSRVPGNARNALELLLDWANKGLPGSRALVVLAGIGLTVLVLSAVRRRTLPERKPVLVVGFGIASLGIICTAHYSYYLGDVRQAFLVRLGLVHALWLVPLATIGLTGLLRDMFRAKGLAVVVALLLFMPQLSYASQDPLGHSLLLYREYREVLTFLEKHPDASTLIITERPGLYTAQGRSAVSFETAQARAQEFQQNLSAGLFAEILVIEHRRGPGAGTPVTPALPESYRLERELMFLDNGDERVEVSRVVPRAP